MISSVSIVRATAPIRTGKAHGRQRVRVLSASSPDKSGEASSSTPPASSASDIKVDTIPKEPNESWKSTLSPAQIFGSYLPVALWAVVLSVAGFTGFQQAQTSPESVGILLAPPGAALFLMASFALYKVLTNDNYKDDKP